jgi:muconate cycloisomerase
MPDHLRIRELRIHRLAIPMRIKFEHAAASRDVADPVVLALSAAAPYAQHAGYGETLARPYVSGETPESVVDDIRNVFLPLLTDFRADSFVSALEFIEALPFQVEGRVITAARAAVELALLDLACQVYRRRPADAAGWMGLIGFGAPGCVRTTRYSGMVVGRTKRKLQWLLRLQRYYGLRDFKLKVATDGWEERLGWAHEVLKAPLFKGRATLRVDANAGWSLAEANDALPLLQAAGVCALEQPLPDANDTDLAYLAEQSSCDIIADESLLTIEDAQRLLSQGGVRVFNVRLAKNGGLLPALRIARLALASGVNVQLGCLVGETSILSAAGIAFLEACPGVRFAEGAYGPWLLKNDVVFRPVRFGRGGRIAPRRGCGWGVEVDLGALERVTQGWAKTIQV